MDVIRTHKQTKKIRLALVFFSFILFCQCRRTTLNDSITVHRVQDKAVSVSFVTSDNFHDLQVFSEGQSNTPVLGEFHLKDTLYTFTPVVPFTEGLSYSILQGDRLIRRFTVDVSENRKRTPEVIAIYPSSDTIPENLLKMYLCFSEPMQEVGQSLDFISITKNDDNEPLEVFLELESELWNAEHTRLTLWLDPGRIKTDLIPNKEKGLPIIKGNDYTITIDGTWRSSQGVPMVKDVQKTFYVSDRDSIEPDIANWEIDTPSAGLKDELILNFKEPLDAILSKESIRVFDENNDQVFGDYKLLKSESYLVFVPERPWNKGVYTVRVNSNLEDLAGNNLNHLFDVNTKLRDDSSDQSAYKSLTFSIH